MGYYKEVVNKLCKKLKVENGKKKDCQLLIDKLLKRVNMLERTNQRNDGLKKVIFGLLERMDAMKGRVVEIFEKIGEEYGDVHKDLFFFEDANKKLLGSIGDMNSAFLHNLEGEVLAKFGDQIVPENAAGLFRIYLGEKGAGPPQNQTQVQVQHSQVNKLPTEPSLNNEDSPDKYSRSEQEVAPVDLAPALAERPRLDLKGEFPLSNVDSEMQFKKPY